MEIESKYEFVCNSLCLLCSDKHHHFFFYRSKCSKNLLLVDMIVKLVQKVLLMSHTSTRATHTPAHSTPG